VRQMTDRERVFAYGVPEYRCCFCGRESLAPGPRGGVSMNMGCATCGVIFNLIAPTYRAQYGDGITFFEQVVREPQHPVKS
jgi:hypothetical protein